MDFAIEIPEACQIVLDIFTKNGYEAYLVGGCVRDSILGKQPLDWDICTNALPQQTIDLFKRYRTVLTGLQHGTVMVLVKGMPIEITTYRIDGDYLDNRHPKEVIFTKDLAKDLSRRDFTINALAYHPQEGLVDYFHGLEDLENHLIRAVGDPAARFQEDGLRIMRAVRFACVLGFDYEIQTKAAIRKYNYLLRNIATERIQIELNKMLLSDHVKQGLYDLYHLGCYPYFLPEMCHTYGFEQVNPCHCYDIFGHIAQSVAIVEPDLILRLAMLLHDIGKPFVWEKCYGDSDCFPQHEIPSVKIAERFLQQMHYDNKTSREVIRLIAAHNEQLSMSEYHIRCALAHFGVDTLRRLIKVKIADMRAQNEKMYEVADILSAIGERTEEIIQRGDCFDLKHLAVTGNDLVALGYQGRAVGETLQHLLERVLQEPKLNQKDVLLALLD